MLEHISNIIPYLDCVKTYLDSMQVNYLVLASHNIGALDPLSEFVTSNYLVIGIRHKDRGIKLTIRKDQWK